MITSAQEKLFRRVETHRGKTVAREGGNFYTFAHAHIHKHMYSHTPDTHSHMNHITHTLIHTYTHT